MKSLRNVGGEQAKIKVLPCRINFTGEVEHEGYVPEGNEGSLFGKKLQGQVLELPEGYEGLVATGNKDLSTVGIFHSLQYWNWDKPATEFDQLPSLLQHLPIMSALENS